MSKFVNSSGLTKHIEALEEKMMIPTGNNKKKYKQVNPFLVDKQKKRSKEQDPLSGASSSSSISSYTETETEMKLNTMNDFYGNSDSDDEEYGEMESIENDEDEAMNGNGGDNSKYHHRKNNFASYREAIKKASKSKSRKMYYAKRALLVKSIFVFCMFIMMSGVMVSHVNRSNGLGKGADFVPASSISEERDASSKHHEHTKHKHGHGHKKSKNKSKSGEKSFAEQMEDEVEEDEKQQGNKAIMVSKLPEGWREFTDKASGKFYYMDPAGQVTWTRPSSHKKAASKSSKDSSSDSAHEATSSKTSKSDSVDESKAKPHSKTSKPKSEDPESDALPDGWREYMDAKTGKSYYMDSHEHTTWERPTSHNTSPELALEDNDSSDSTSDNSSEKDSNSKVEKDSSSEDDEESSSKDTKDKPFPLLAMGWREYTDKKSGKPYYMSPQGMVTWERPAISDDSPASSSHSEDSTTDSKSVGSSTELEMGWKEYKDEKSGKSYYMSPEGKVTWERPTLSDDSSNANKDNSSKDNEDSSSEDDKDSSSKEGKDQPFPVLAMGWKEYEDKKSGKSYYMSPEGKVTWERPTISDDSSNSNKDNSSKDNEDSSSEDDKDSSSKEEKDQTFPVLAMGWREYKDEKSGKPYYMSPEGKVTWERPMNSDDSPASSSNSKDSTSEKAPEPSSDSKSTSSSTDLKSNSEDVLEEASNDENTSSSQMEGGATESLVEEKSSEQEIWDALADSLSGDESEGESSDDEEEEDDDNKDSNRRQLY